MILTVSAVFIFAIDRISKYVMLSSMRSGESIRVFGFFYITPVFNTGASFGLFKDQNIFFTCLSVIVIGLVIAYALKFKVRDGVRGLALGLIVGGAAGNLVDRLRFGCVVDFLDLRVWPVFNVADSAITIGVALLAWNILIRQSKHHSNV